MVYHAYISYARVMELVDMLDSKSGNRKVVWVRVPSLVKNKPLVKSKSSPR